MLVARHVGDVEVVFFSTAQALWRILCQDCSR